MNKLWNKNNLRSLNVEVFNCFIKKKNYHLYTQFKRNTQIQWISRYCLTINNVAFISYK